MNGGRRKKEQENTETFKRKTSIGPDFLFNLQKGTADLASHSTPKETTLRNTDVDVSGRTSEGHLKETLPFLQPAESC